MPVPVVLVHRGLPQKDLDLGELPHDLLLLLVEDLAALELLPNLVESVGLVGHVVDPGLGHVELQLPEVDHHLRPEFLLQAEEMLERFLEVQA